MKFGGGTRLSSAVYVLALVACAAQQRRPHHVSPVKRPSLVTSGVTLLHQVSIESAQRNDVLIGRLTFRDAQSFDLTAQTPLGLTLFSLQYDGRTLRSDVRPPLRGKFPIEPLAKLIHRVYFAQCAWTTSNFATKSAQIRCHAEGDIQIQELIDLQTLQPRHKRIYDGNVWLDIHYSDFRATRAGQQPHHISVTNDKFKIQIVLSQLL